MSTLKQSVKAAFDAIERVASAQGVAPGDRAVALAQLRNRLSDHIARLGDQVIRDNGGNPTGQKTEEGG